MCEKCDHQELGEIVKKHQGMIKEYGHSMVGVFDAEEPFVYTVGLAGQGYHELIVASRSLPVDILANVINFVVARLQKGQPAEEGEFTIGGDFPLKLRKTTKTGSDLPLSLSFQIKGDWDFEVMQVLLPDPNGKYAGEEEVKATFDVTLY